MKMEKTNLCIENSKCDGTGRRFVGSCLVMMRLIGVNHQRAG